MKVRKALFSPSSAAESLDISRAQIYALMKAGLVKYVYVGADRRIPAAEISRIATEGIATKVAA